MADEQGQMLRDQLGELWINVRNELIVQAANAYIYGRQAMLAGLGALALGKDELEAILTRLVERGEIAESDMQQVIEHYLKELRGEAREADSARASMTVKAAIALQENVRTILEKFRLPGGISVEELVRREAGNATGKTTAASKGSGQTHDTQP
ncbi:MAG: phasin family protein [Caldilineaceae bacterium]|nr:phasin family protein [Caldilineaceae bacterium]